jgi:hypothetical protein
MIEICKCFYNFVICRILTSNTLIYQLPNGKVINITVEQFLSMSDDDIQYMVAHNHGESVNSPWYGSAVHYSKRIDKNPEHDEQIDFQEEFDEAQQHILPEEGVALDEFPDLGDNSEEE